MLVGLSITFVKPALVKRFGFLRVTRVYVSRYKWIFRFLQWVILLGKELASIFVCGTNILVWTHLKCGERPLVFELWHQKMFLIGTTSSKRAEDELKTNYTLDDHQHLLMRATSKKSKIWCLEIFDWQFCLELDSYRSSTTVLAWFGSMRLLAIQQTQNANAGSTFWQNWVDKKRIEEDLESST